MKLKKVVSLALAGVMAVSMLAGCGTTKPDPNPGKDEGETTKTGYSAEFADIADIDLDYVSFKDSTVDAAALKDLVDSYSDVEIFERFIRGNFNIGGSTITGTSAVDATSDAKAAAFLSDVDARAGYFDGFFNADSATGVQDVDMNISVNAAKVYVVDGTVSMNQALTMVYNRVKSALKDTVLVEQGADKGVTYDFNYTVSVSVVSRSTTISTVVEAPVRFVAVSITRTGTPAKV